jgi:polar amino acid transport system ATP-binding protein
VVGKSLHHLSSEMRRRALVQDAEAGGFLDDVVIHAEGVCKAFGHRKVLRGIDLEVARGEVVCLLGPSGSGKSTFLLCINNLEKVDSGRLWVNGDLVGYRRGGGHLYELREREAARKRSDIGMVFQQFNLFPHMTALENVSLAPVLVKRQPRAEVERRAKLLLQRVGLDERADAYPSQLSGGQQ